MTFTGYVCENHRFLLEFEYVNFLIEVGKGEPAPITDAPMECIFCRGSTSDIFVEFEEDLKSYLKERNASEKRQKAKDEAEYQAGTYPILVIAKDVDGLIMHEVQAERSEEPLFELYGNRYTLYTGLSLGKHTVGELGQWKALRNKEKSLKDKFQEAKQTNKPVLISSHEFDSGDDRGWAITKNMQCLMGQPGKKQNILIKVNKMKKNILAVLDGCERYGMEINLWKFGMPCELQFAHTFRLDYQEAD